MKYICTRSISKVSHTNLLVTKTIFFNPFRISIISVVHCFLKFQVVKYCGLGVHSYLRIFIILPIMVQPLCKCCLLRQLRSFVVFLVFKTKN